MASVLALSYPLPLSEIQLRPISSDSFQGNSLIANYQPYISDTQKSYATMLGKDDSCLLEYQCVAYVKSKGIQLPQGNAKDLRPNSDVPCVGCGVLLSIGRWGHIAYLEEVDMVGNRIYISEMNWISCGIISYRWLNIDDLTIRGYITPQISVK